MCGENVMTAKWSAAVVADPAAASLKMLRLVLRTQPRSENAFVVGCGSINKRQILLRRVHPVLRLR